MDEMDEHPDRPNTTVEAPLQTPSRRRRRRNQEPTSAQSTGSQRSPDLERTLNGTDLEFVVVPSPSKKPKHSLVVPFLQP